MRTCVCRMKTQRLKNVIKGWKKGLKN
ncbi:hypothetical protein MAR_002907 [Mya arenaria]|uniref:Uncharacterized protein n=1 Tax=Mya arenaria TaxID=6604 RepID=A0ABY7G723_MYAAR|nr:hypothetical protein MAR_002907 [Mya arenaria]